MPPQLASLLTWAFIIYLFRRNSRERPNVTAALWIPTIWLFIISTRAVSSWLVMFGVRVGGRSLEEGSPVDALVFLVLILAGLRVLARRRVRLVEVIRNNRWLAVYLAYCFVAIAWSDFPFVSSKRWFKNLGHPIMVLILLSEPDFVSALTCLMKRCAYTVVPISILFIKYYPEWGRGFNEWNGQGYNTGITEGKNLLGADCLVLSFFFVWYLVTMLRSEDRRAQRSELILCVAFLGMICWLFFNADSKTPLVSLTVSLVIFGIVSLSWVNRRHVLTYISLVVVVGIVLEEAIGIYKPTLELLGRNESLTERTPLWAELREWGKQQPILGTGFESFWLGERREQIWRKLRWNPNQSHNGYLETYINLGVVGLAFLACLVGSTLLKTKSALVAGTSVGRFRFALLFGILVYNWTEASLYGLHLMFFMFFVVAMDYPKRMHDRHGADGDRVPANRELPLYDRAKGLMNFVEPRVRSSCSIV